MFYRNNWYLDACCHQRQALRRFSVDALETIELLTEPAHEVSDAEMAAEFASSYGIYSGSEAHIAHLRFSPAAARWVADEAWHPDQIGQYDANGYFILEVPYAEPTELLMDILRHGLHVEVLEPLALRQMICEVIQGMTNLYQAEKQ